MAADGTIQIDINVNDNRAQNSLNNLNNNANNAGKSFSSLGKIIAGVGSVILGAQLINSVKNFTVESVKAAGAAEALNAQFSQVFGNLENAATASLNAIADETQILPDRLKGSFTQIAAFARTAGFDNAQALELTSRATLAAADSAAFYDRSIESVTESLQGYLKGNYANDAALGISSTETTRNAKANELYGKSFNKLSEAQKQLTLLAQVEDANKLSGALGQAAREGTGLENVTGNLSQAWENFKVAIGGNFLDLAVRGMIALTAAIQNINVESISAALSRFAEILSNIASFAIPIVIEAFNFLKDVVSQVIEFITPFFITLQELWTTNSEAILLVVTNAFGLVRDTISTVVTTIVNFIRPQLEKIGKFWEENGKQITEAAQNAFNLILGIVEFVMPAIRLIIDIVWNAIKDIITGALNVIMGAVKVFAAIFTGDFSKLWEGIKQIFRGAIDFILGLMTLSFFGGIRTILTNLAKSGIAIIRGLWDDALNLFRSFVNGGVSTISGFVSNIVNFFRNLALRVLTTILEIRRDGVKYFVDLGVGAINAIKNLPSQFLQIGKDIIASLINGLKSLNPIAAIQNIGNAIVDGFKSIFGGQKVSAEIGEQIPVGIATGVKKNSPKAIAAFTEFKDEYVAVADDFVKEQAVSSLADIKGLEDTEKKKKSTREKATKDLKSADEKYLEQLEDTVKRGREYGNLTVAQEADMWKQALGVLTNGSNEYLAARNNYQNAVIEGFEQKKKAGDVSLADEAEFWKGLLSTFKVGSDQYVEANEKYRETITKINDTIVKTNEDFAKRIQDVNADLVKQEQDLTDAYNKAYDDRYKKLSQFSGLFDEFGINTEVTGDGLVNNLESQVQGFQSWQRNITELSKRAIDDGLLAELRAAGPQALSELIALNSLTDEQLKRYSDLYLLRSIQAREQTNKELTGLRLQTSENINALQNQTRKQLDGIEKDWVRAISNIVSSTENGFSGLEQIGVGAGQNLYNGLASVEPSLIAKARSIAANVQAALASALSVVSNPVVNFSGATAPSSTNGYVPASISNNNAKTQINNYTVQTNNQKVELERLARQNAFAF